MNTYSVFPPGPLALAFGVTLSACSSTPADQQPSTQTGAGHGLSSSFNRPMRRKTSYRRAISSLSILTPRRGSPSAISLPAQPDFVVGPAGTQGVTHTTIQAAVDALLPATPIVVSLSPSCRVNMRAPYTFRRRLAR